jgi:hypothetical protein
MGAIPAAQCASRRREFSPQVEFSQTIAAAPRTISRCHLRTAEHAARPQQPFPSSAFICVICGFSNLREANRWVVLLPRAHEHIFTKIGEQWRFPQEQWQSLFPSSAFICVICGFSNLQEVNRWVAPRLLLGSSAKPRVPLPPDTPRARATGFANAGVSRPFVVLPRACHWLRQCWCGPTFRRVTGCRRIVALASRPPPPAPWRPSRSLRPRPPPPRETPNRQRPRQHCEHRGVGHGRNQHVAPAVHVARRALSRFSWPDATKMGLSPLSPRPTLRIPIAAIVTARPILT